MCHEDTDTYNAYPPEHVPTIEPDRSDYLSRQNVLLKTLLVREYMRRGVSQQDYKTIELDEAREQMNGWMIDPDGQGNYLSHRES